MKTQEPNGVGTMNLLARTFTRTLAAAALAATFAAQPVAAQDTVKVGVFPISSSLPYFVALDLGYFKELNLEPETIRLMGGPSNVAAMITNQIEVAAVLVTLEGLNADVKKPVWEGVADLFQLVPLAHRRGDDGHLRVVPH